MPSFQLPKPKLPLVLFLTIMTLTVSPNLTQSIMVGEFKGVETLTGNLFPPSGQKKTD